MVQVHIVAKSMSTCMCICTCTHTCIGWAHIGGGWVLHLGL